MIDLNHLIDGLRLTDLTYKDDSALNNTGKTIDCMNKHGNLCRVRTNPNNDGVTVSILGPSKVRDVFNCDCRINAETLSCVIDSIEYDGNKHNGALSATGAIGYYMINNENLVETLRTFSEISTIVKYRSPGNLRATFIVEVIPDYNYVLFICLDGDYEYSFNIRFDHMDSEDIVRVFNRFYRSDYGRKGITLHYE